MNGDAQAPASFGDDAGAGRGSTGRQMGAELNTIGASKGGLKRRFKISDANLDDDVIAHGVPDFYLEGWQSIEGRNRALAHGAGVLFWNRLPFKDSRVGLLACGPRETATLKKQGTPAVTERPEAMTPTSASPLMRGSEIASCSRRDLLKGSAVAGAAAVSSGLIVPMVHAGGSSTIKVGLVGCGGRGTGAAEQALTADSGTRLFAMADVFADRLQESLTALQGLERRFAGRCFQGPPV